MWKVTRFPSLGDGEDGFKAEQLFLGWKHILAYRNSKLIDLVTGKEILRGPLDGCSLSRDFCAILHGSRCRVLGLYNDSIIDIPIDGVQQVSMLERGRLVVRTQSKVLVYDLKARAVARQWSLACSEISAGFDHFVAVTTEGKLYSWGDGSRGQQGSGHLELSEDLVPVEALEDVSITKIAAGGWHSTALSNRGFVYQWGWNQHGQSGAPSTSEQLQRNNGTRTVVACPTLREVSRVRVVDIACGSRHSVALDELGILRCWGWNGYGQCDLGEERMLSNTLQGIEMDIKAVDTIEHAPDRDDVRKAERRLSAEVREGTTSDVESRNKACKPLRVCSAFWTTAVEYSITTSEIA